MKHDPKNTIRQGFSLAEMLLVIGVIGILAALAIPSIASVNTASTAAEQQRNAQTFGCIFNSGQAAGCDWVTTSLAALVADMTNGRTPASGPFAGQVFKMSALKTMSQADIVGMESYLTIDTSSIPNGLFYTPTKAQNNGFNIFVIH